MTPERWKQIEEVFHAALERGPESRVAFLDEVCAGDSALRDEVESLLEADQQAKSSFIIPLSTETKSVSTTPQLQTQNKRADLYCPKCGEPNSDKVKYCRGCGENLKTVARMLTGHIPVKLAVKIEELVERKHERLRRDGIFGVLFGLFLFFIGWMWFADIVVISYAIFSLGWGIWNLLAYKRSLALENAPNQIASSLKKIYCPRCGELNYLEVNFCRKCGENLKVVAKSMTRGWPALLARKLDQYIDKKNTFIANTLEEMGLSLRLYVAIAVTLCLLTLLFGGFVLVKVHVAGGVFFVFLSLVVFVFFAWDVLNYKLNLPAGSMSEDGSAETMQQELWRIFRQDLMDEDDFISLNLSGNEELRSKDSSTSLATKKLPSPDTSIIEPPSVTEATTKRLDIAVERQKEKS